MSQVLVALIGAVAAIVVAWINRPHAHRPWEAKRQTAVTIVKQPFRATRVFIFLLAPIFGAAALSLLYKGATVIAGPPELKAPFCIQGYFYPSGWMGDAAKSGKVLELNDHWRDNCHSNHSCSQFTYRPGNVGWGGVYWQYPDGNWGDEPGRRIIGATKLVFWARGQNGGEEVDFKMGGINGKKYQDSFERVLPSVELTTDWKRFEIDLKNADTRMVIGAFSWSANRQGNPQGLTFYLDDICFQ